MHQQLRWCGYRVFIFTYIKYIHRALIHIQVYRPYGESLKFILQNNLAIDFFYGYKGRDRYKKCMNRPFIREQCKFTLRCVWWFVVSPQIYRVFVAHRKHLFSCRTGAWWARRERQGLRYPAFPRFVKPMHPTGGGVECVLLKFTLNFRFCERAFRNN